MRKITRKKHCSNFWERRSLINIISIIDKINKERDHTGLQAIAYWTPLGWAKTTYWTQPYDAHPEMSKETVLGPITEEI